MKRGLLEQWLIDNNWERDEWGHYHKMKITNEGELKEARIKMQDSTLRYEISLGENDWGIITCDYYRSCKIIDNKLRIDDLLVS